MVFALGSRAQLAKAIDLGIMVLGKGLGEHFPNNPTSLHVAFELLKTRRLLSRLSDADIMALPKMIESNKLVALRLMLLLVVYTASLSDPIFPFLIMRLVQLTIRYGISAMSAPVFSMWGVLLCNGVKDIEGGIRYARLGLTLQNQSSTGEWQSRVQVFSNGFCLIWTESLCDQLDSLQESHEAGIRSGDIETAVLASCGKLFVSSAQAPEKIRILTVPNLFTLVFSSCSVQQDRTPRL
jgi:histidine kinase